MTFDPFPSNGRDVIAGNVRSMVPGELATGALLPPHLPQLRAVLRTAGRAIIHCQLTSVFGRRKVQKERPYEANNDIANVATKRTKVC